MASIRYGQLPRELLAIIQQPCPSHHCHPRSILARTEVVALPQPRLRLRYQAPFSTLARSDKPTDPSPASPSPSSYTPSTVDPTEISHFDALAGSWWDPFGPSRLLHLMNPLRHTFIQSCLSSSSAPHQPLDQKLHYLDVGCGGGIFAESAARLPSTGSVTALDPSASVLRVAESHKRRDPLLLQPGRLAYYNSSVEELADKAPIPAGGFDVVTLFEVLEHVASPSAFLAAATAHVKPGGWLVASTIARTPAAWLVTKLLAEDVLRLVPRGTHDWNKYIHERELRDWFVRRGGWGDAKALGVMYVPGLGWTEVPFRGGEAVGNYFFGIRREER